MKKDAEPIEKPDLVFELFRMSCELRGLSELFAHQKFQEPADDIDECLEGIGFLLRGMGEKLKELHSIADMQNFQRSNPD